MLESGESSPCHGEEECTQRPPELDLVCGHTCLPLFRVHYKYHIRQGLKVVSHKYAYHITLS